MAVVAARVDGSSAMWVACMQFALPTAALAENLDFFGCLADRGPVY